MSNQISHPGQLSFDLGDVVAPPAAKKPRRRMQPWEVERAKLKTWQAERRRADRVEPWKVAEHWPRFDPSLETLKLILRVEREYRRCGCRP